MHMVSVKGGKMNYVHLSLEIPHNERYNMLLLTLNFLLLTAITQSHCVIYYIVEVVE